eukprot:CAMPEP_0198204590 /NCGR_PEP_ID=MMETSP1445-20131203/8004_1 /TAXON_ID=36898 /ORGANISM="Pyramimonas sp., Strain CCMP2087" /LENGTH=91 /DNA_ID=CAMNT_0043876535 /DNA_START=60 /DNA_END=335 /DNA_ORIENTATION=-
MSFFTDFARHVVEAYMEVPEERNKAIHDHLIMVKARCDEILADRAKPQKAYGFWSNSTNNAVLMNQREPALAKMPGRQQTFESETRSSARF